MMCGPKGGLATLVLALGVASGLSAATGDPAADVRFQSLASYAAAHPGTIAYRENFDDALGTSAPESGTGTPLPRGWYGTFDAKPAGLGAVLDPAAKTNTWCQNGYGIRNVAGRELYDTKPAANANNQNTSANRALGVTTKTGVGETYTGAGAAALGLNLKTTGYTVSYLRFDFTSFSINDTKTAPAGDPVSIGSMLNWSLQAANNPAGPWATLQTITHATQLGGAAPGGVYTYHVEIPDVAAAAGTGVAIGNQAAVYFRLVTTSSTTGVGGTARASYAIDNFELGCQVLPGFVYNGEDDQVADPDARFDYIQNFNGLDATALNATPWSNGWSNDGDPGNRYGLKGWYVATTTRGAPDNRYVSGNGYIYTFERDDAGAISYNPDGSVLYNATGGPPAVVNYGGVSGADNIANRNLGFRFSHEGAKNRNEAFYLGYVYTNTTGRPVTAVEAAFYVPYWQRMGNPAWVRLDFSYKNLGPNFQPAGFRIHEVTGATLVDETDAQGRHSGLSYLQFEYKGGLSSGTSFPKNDSQSWSLYDQNMSADKAGTFTLSSPLQPGESLLLLWSTHGNGIDYGAHIVALDNVKLRFITADASPVSQPPVFLSSPGGQSFQAGGSISLGVFVKGTAPFTYQWRKNGVPVDGAMADSLVIDNAAASDAGAYTVTVANAAGTVTSPAAQLSLAAGPQQQAITFPALSDLTYGAQPFAITATADSGLPVTVTVVSGPATLNGSTVTLTGTGTVILRATQAGNDNYLAADPVDRSFAVGQAPQAAQTIAFASPPGHIYGDGPFALAATADSGLPVTFTVVSGPATLNGTTVTLTGTGSITLRAAQTGNAGYLAATPVDRSFSVAPAPLTVTAGNHSRLYGEANPAFTLTYSGFINNETAAVLTPPAASTTATPSSPAGTYPITLVGGSAANYALTLVPGTLTVLPQNQVHDYTGTYFGTFASGGHWALYVRGDRTATYLAHLPARSSALLVNLTINLDGTFSAVGTEIKPLDASPRAQALVTLESPLPRVAAATSFTLAGQIAAGGAVTGSLTGLGETFTGAVDTGTAQTPALYTASALGTATGTTYAIVGPSGQTFVVTTSSTAADSAIGLVNASGQLTATTAANSALILTLAAQSLTATLTPAGSTTPTAYAGLPDTVIPVARVVNLSVRTTAGTDDQTLIVGFVITGTGTKNLLLRGVGPTLSTQGVAAPLADPALRLLNVSATELAANNDWGGGASLSQHFAELGAFALPAGSKDAALFVPLAAGLYSVHILSNDTSKGIALAEFYDADAGNATVANLSARALVGTGENILIAGFVITGNAPKALLIRGLGPTLATQGVGGVLADPQLSLIGPAGVIAFNDDWGGAAALLNAFVATGASALAANSSKDAALLVTLPPGVYSAQVSGVGNTTGVGLVEVYLVP